ncbi:MAG TPA: helix-turn-helix transcriptional regulator [Capillimicrobium sp.]
MDGTVTLRHTSGELSYELHLRSPSAPLRGLVTGLQGFAERSAAPVMRRELPSGDAVLILDLDAGWRVAEVGSRAPARMASFVGGISDAPSFAGHDGRAECVQVDLTPAGVRALLGVPAGELANTVVGLDDLLGADGRRLVEALHGAPTWLARFRLLEAALARRALEAPPPRHDVQRAWQRLQATDGALPVEALARELRCSRRHLARRFAEDVGLGPKAFARVLRFRRAAALLRDPGGPPIVDVALRCGYADQAHLTRETRELSGVTPGALRAAALPGGGGVGATADDVPSVQDEPARAA